MSVVEGIMYRVRWVTMPGCCAKCVALNGREWVLQTLDETFISLLRGSVSHPHCKCELDVEVDVDLERLQIG